MLFSLFGSTVEECDASWRVAIAWQLANYSSVEHMEEVPGLGLRTDRVESW